MMNIENEILELSDYQCIRPCSNNLFIVGNPLRAHWLKYGVVDINGKIIIPLSFISIYEEVGKYFRVRRITDDKTAMYDMNGNLVIGFGQYLFWWSFWGSYIKVKQDGLYGLLDMNLSSALPCKFTNMFECDSGKHGNCYGVKNHSKDGWYFYDNRTLCPTL